MVVDVGSLKCHARVTKGVSSQKMGGDEGGGGRRRRRRRERMVTMMA
jgi:hypothetical protein